MSKYISCAFGGAAGTSLNGYAGDSGVSWTAGTDTVRAGGPTDIIMDGNGFVYGNGTTTVMCPSGSWTLPTTLNIEVQFTINRGAAKVTNSSAAVELAVSSYATFAQDLYFSFADLSAPTWSLTLNANASSLSSTTTTNTTTIPAIATTWLIKVVVASANGSATATAYYSTNLTTPSWTSLCSLTFATPACVVRPGLRFTGTASTAANGVRLGAFTVQDITPNTTTLTGPTVGITGVPQEFLVTLNGMSPSGGDTITLTSANGSDTFSATPGGSTVSTISIPANTSAPVPFYLEPAGTSARNISITDGNGYTVSGSPISFTPSATLSDPTAFSWVNGGTFRPGSLVDPNQVLFDQSDFTSFTAAGTYNYGTTAPTVTYNSSGITIASGAINEQVTIALPLSCYPAVGMAFLELTFGSQAAGGGTLAWGPALIRTDATYPGSMFYLWLTQNGGTQAGYRINSTTAANTLTLTNWETNGPYFFEAGTVITAVFSQNVATLFYRPPNGIDQYIGGLSSSTINASATGTEIASIVSGTCDQRDTTIAPDLTLGLSYYSTSATGSLNITRVRAGTYYGGSTLAQIPVRNTLDGSPYTDGSGNCLVICQNQGPSIDGNHNYQAWEATHWYYPATDTLSLPLTRFASSRTAPYNPGNPSGSTRLCLDSDGMVLYENRPGNADYGQWHVFQGTTGTNFQFKGNDSTYNTYAVNYNLYSGNLTTEGQIIVLSSPTTVSLPSGVAGHVPYEFKVVVIDGTWYSCGICCTGTAGASPGGTLFWIASGSSPTSMTTAIYGPSQPGSITNWDGVGIARYQGVWYAFPVSGTSTECWNLQTGASVGTMASPLNGPFTGFVPHTNPYEYQFMAGGLPCRQYRRLSHDNNFVAWGQDWSVGGTKPNTWMFGNLITNRSPIFPGLEFQPTNTVAPALLGL